MPPVPELVLVLVLVLVLPPVPIPPAPPVPIPPAPPVPIPPAPPVPIPPVPELELVLEAVEVDVLVVLVPEVVPPVSSSPLRQLTARGTRARVEAMARWRGSTRMMARSTVP
jgi:hypothetical protein